jgi:NADP-dependent aldehyde dehydrogenase
MQQMTTKERMQPEPSVEGVLIIGSRTTKGGGDAIQGFNPATGQVLEPVFLSGGGADLDAACALADAASEVYRETDLEKRADFLDSIAANIRSLGEALVQRAIAESGLPAGRMRGELDRTVNQLGLFANVVRRGDFLEVRVDPALPDRQPMRRPDIRQRHIGLGPVAVFGASNFPLAFSVAGGDTASALAAGCPVIVKGHSSHPGTSELVGRAIQAAVAAHGLPEGVFSLLFGSGSEIGAGLVGDPRIKAVGFTGSRTGGHALIRIAQSRPEPIPVYAEMSSINPVILLPDALRTNGSQIATAFVAALTLGAGQFCTNPGLVIALDGPDVDAFASAAAAALAAVEAAPMLTPGIHSAYAAGVERLRQHPKVATVAQGKEGLQYHGRSALFSVTASDFIAHPELAEEVFGAASLLVRCRDLAQLRSVLMRLEGQLTAALHMTTADADTTRELLPILERKAGRILVNGFGTGVEVGHAMVHGGPYPATSDPRTTSVGSLAIRRFLRPVAYQDFPDALLPCCLQSANPWKVRRLIDGKLETT